jgi:DtxR family Mn-dependent transcriptional regulator
MAAALDNPTVDPHGDPIPSKDGRIEKTEGVALSLAELNRPYRLVRVLVQDPERLNYLGGLGLYPNAAITLLKRAPFSGPLLIDVAGDHQALAYEMAELLMVAPEG